MCEHDLILLASGCSGKHYYNPPIFKCKHCLKIFKLDEQFSIELIEVSFK